MATMTYQANTLNRRGFAGTADSMAGVRRYTSTGVGKEALYIDEALLQAMRHAVATITQATVEKQFNDLAFAWRIDTQFTSSINTLTAHPSYQRIIGLGPAVIPFILQEISVRPDYWFWALESLTGVNPVPEEHYGSVEAMSADWLDWGRSKGYIR